jgi:hypothetical protein
MHLDARPAQAIDQRSAMSFREREMEKHDTRGDFSAGKLVGLNV